MALFKRTEGGTYRVGRVTVEDISFIGLLLTVLYTAGAIFLAYFSYQVGEPLSLLSMLLLIGGVGFCILSIAKSAKSSVRGAQILAKYVFLDECLCIGYARKSKYPAVGWRQLWFKIPCAKTTSFKYDLAAGILTVHGNISYMCWHSADRGGQRDRPEHTSSCSTIVVSMPIGFPGKLVSAICADGRIRNH